MTFVQFAGQLPPSYTFDRRGVVGALERSGSNFLTIGKAERFPTTDRRTVYRMIPIERGRALTHVPKLSIYNNSHQTSLIRPLADPLWTFTHWSTDQPQRQHHVPHHFQNCPHCLDGRTTYFVGYVPALLFLEMAGDRLIWQPVIWFIPEQMTGSKAFLTGFAQVFQVNRTTLKSSMMFKVGVSEDQNRYGVRSEVPKHPPVDLTLQMARIWRVNTTILETPSWKPGQPVPIPQLIAEASAEAAERIDAQVETILNFPSNHAMKGGA